MPQSLREVSQRQHHLDVSWTCVEVRTEAIDGLPLVDLVGSLHTDGSPCLGYCPEPITGFGRRAVALRFQLPTNFRTSPGAPTMSEPSRNASSASRMGN